LNRFFITLFGAVILFLFLQPGLYRKGKQTNFELFRDKTFQFFSSTIRGNLNVKIVLFFPVLYLTFLFILLANLVGMLPWSFTVTSSAAVTFFFSLSLFIGVTLAGYGYHRNTLFQILLPAGVPLVIAPFLVLVELASYVARGFSLAIRLFANMMSGHGLLKILGSFVFIIIQHSSVICPLFLPAGLVFIVVILELAVAFLQAYVFIVLVAVYLNDVICIH
jgi:ATP synthase subunit 6